VIWFSHRLKSVDTAANSSSPKRTFDGGAGPSLAGSTGKASKTRIRHPLRRFLRWYYRQQFLLLAITGLITPILVVAVTINGLGGRTVAELRAHQEKLFEVLGLFGWIALSFSVAGFVFAISTWVLWVDRASEQIRGRAWAILGCFLIALLYIASSLSSKSKIYWAVPTIEFTGMLVFWRARGPLWKFRGKGIRKLVRKRGGLLRFVFRKSSAPA
jgi:hypothetical protein